MPLGLVGVASFPLFILRQRMVDVGRPNGTGKLSRLVFTLMRPPRFYSPSILVDLPSEQASLLMMDCFEVYFPNISPVGFRKRPFGGVATRPYLVKLP